MSDYRTTMNERRIDESTGRGSRLRSALAQLREDARVYNEAVGSYNTHLDNHRDRRDLHDLPFRPPVTAHDAFDDAVRGDPAAIDALLEHLVDQAHLDSELRRHPRTYPIHVEATEHLRIARDRLVSTLEAAYRQVRETRE